MTTILLALGDRALREACDAHLRATGLLPLQLQRPLEIVDLRTKLACDLVCLDETQLGIDTLTVVRGGLAGPLPVVGIGVDAPGVAASLALPLQLQSLTAAIAALTTPFVRAMEPAAATGQALPRLTFDPVRRTVSARGQSVSLTRTEYRLLEYLQAETDRDVTIEELLDGVWGTSEGIGTAALIRSHIRQSPPQALAARRRRRDPRASRSWLRLRRLIPAMTLGGCSRAWGYQGSSSHVSRARPVRASVAPCARRYSTAPP